MYRIGQGFDIHVLAENRKLILGGIEIQYNKGLLGHSDADVLIHAVIDALFGALAAGDIGTHFPDSSPEYKNIDSCVLLKKAYDLVKNEGYTVNNIDCTILAEEPKMKPYIPLMREKLSKLLEIGINQLSIKAKTMEKQDSIGQQNSIAAQCCLLLKKSDIIA